MLSAFATMGSVMEKVMGRANPSVGLVNNGAEGDKGHQPMLRRTGFWKYNKTSVAGKCWSQGRAPRAM